MRVVNARAMSWDLWERQCVERWTRVYTLDLSENKTFKDVFFELVFKTTPWAY